MPYVQNIDKSEKLEPLIAARQKDKCTASKAFRESKHVGYRSYISLFRHFQSTGALFSTDIYIWTNKMAITKTKGKLYGMNNNVGVREEVCYRDALHLKN